VSRVVLGVGNRLSRDDGAGPVVACRMRDEPGWTAIDCGTALENVAGLVSRAHPDLVVVVDAARMDLPPGSVRRVPRLRTDCMLASTHGLPLSFTLDRIVSSARVVLIGIEPCELSFGEELSAPVREAVDRLVSALREGRLDVIPRWADPDVRAGDPCNKADASV
jgi:hydrogenase 3 maturation protease